MTKWYEEEDSKMIICPKCKRPGLPTRYGNIAHKVRIGLEELSTRNPHFRLKIFRSEWCKLKEKKV